MSEEADLDPKTKAVFDRKGYRVLGKISQGAFGKVFKAERTETGTLSAVKVMDTTKMPARFVREFLPRELEMLKRVKNPNVLDVYDIFRSSKKLWIFMEYASGGALTSRCSSVPVDERDGKRWFRQVAEAVVYMHVEMSVCHRDIKTDNVLIDYKNDAKLTDFGFAKRIEESEGIINTVCGTIPYYSPEIIKASCYKGTSYSAFSADDWAMGIMLYAMLTTKWAFTFDPKGSRQGFRIMHRAMMTRAYQDRPHFTRLPQGAKHLIDHLLDPDPKTRYTSRKYVRHPWLTQSE